jgi:glycosyltransferase involved in cell wall biosynthesis
LNDAELVGICYIAPDVEVPHYKGSSTHVLELSRALTALGHRVHVISRRRRLSPEAEDIEGVTYHRVYRGIVGPIGSKVREASSTASEGGGGLYSRAYHLYLETAFALYVGHVAARMIDSYGLDVIIERETAFGAGAIASMISGRPMVLEMIGPRFSPLSMRRSSKVIAYNELMVPERAMSKTVFVKAAVNMALFRPNPDAGRRVREQLNLDGAVTVGYIGSFLGWHGVEDLLDAAEIIKRQSGEVEFLMVGPHTEAVVRSAEGRGLGDMVRFVGPVPYDQVPSYVNACDILIAPYNILHTSSRRDKGIGSPLKVLEYMACGKPAIGSNLPQVADLIEDGKTGLLFPQGDSRSLATSIMALATDLEYRKRLGEQALASVGSAYSWPALAGQISSILEEVRGSNG